MWERCSASLAKAGVLLGAEGLRASSEGVRLRFTAGTRTVVHGPFEGDNELPAGFSILRTRSLEDAIEWATRQAESCLGRRGDRHPPRHRAVGHRHECAAGRRQHAPLHGPAQGHRLDEAGEAPSSATTTELARLIDETTRSGVHLVTETMRPSRRGRRYKNSRDGVSVNDGPFTETKELIGGYVVVSAASLEDAGRWAVQYLDAVRSRRGRSARTGMTIRWRPASAEPGFCGCPASAGRMAAGAPDFHLKVEATKAVVRWA